MSALDRLKAVKVLVGIPSRGVWEDKFGMSLCALIAYCAMAKHPYRNFEVKPANVRGSILPNQRLDCVQMAQDMDATHLFFVDTDQTYPKDTLHRLLKHDKDVVACNIATKQVPSHPTARYYNPAKPFHGEPVYNDPSKGLEKVWRVGTGVMLIRMSVFERIGIDVFGNPFQPSVKRYQGEDWTLVTACEREKIEVFIDHHLSEQVTHIGPYAYDHNVVGEILQREVSNG